MKSKSFFKHQFSYTFKNSVFIIAALYLIMFVLCQTFSNLYPVFVLSAYSITNYFTIWQFFTYSFIHLDIFPLALSEIMLLCFGPPIEKALGTKEFLFFYFLVMFFSGLFSFIIYQIFGYTNVPILGAFDIIYGLLLCYSVLYPTAKVYLFFLIPIPMSIIIAISLGIELASQLSNGIIQLTHLFGFFFAWIYFLIRKGINPWKIWRATSC